MHEMKDDYVLFKNFIKMRECIISESSLRWIIFCSRKNKSSLPFLRKLGRRILISPSLFVQWINCLPDGQTDFSIHENIGNLVDKR